jgi:hypothetical protein
MEVSTKDRDEVKEGEINVPSKHWDRRGHHI